MKKSRYEEILEKVKDATTFGEYRKILTDDELAIFGIHEAQYREELGEDDECLVKDILLLLKASRRSTRHSMFLLDEVKNALLTLSFPMR